VTSGTISRARFATRGWCLHALLVGIACPWRVFGVAAWTREFGWRRRRPMWRSRRVSSRSFALLLRWSPSTSPLAWSSFDTEQVSPEAHHLHPRRRLHPRALPVFVTLGASAGFAGSFVLQYQRNGAGSGRPCWPGCLLVPAHTRRSTPAVLAMLLGLVALFNVMVDLPLGDLRHVCCSLGGADHRMAGALALVALNVFHGPCSSIQAPGGKRHTVARPWSGAPSLPAGRPAWDRSWAAS